MAVLAIQMENRMSSSKKLYLKPRIILQGWYWRRRISPIFLDSQLEDIPTTDMNALCGQQHWQWDRELPSQMALLIHHMYASFS